MFGDDHVWPVWRTGGGIRHARVGLYSSLTTSDLSVQAVPDHPVGDEGIVDIPAMRDHSRCKDDVVIRPEDGDPQPADPLGAVPLL